MLKIFFATIVFAAVNAKAQNMVMTDETTDVTFVARHLVSNLEGAFKGVNGSAFLDSNNLAASFLKLAFATSTIIKEDYTLSPNLMKVQCFNPSQFPQIELSSTAITKLAPPNRYQFTGTLNVKGISKDITFPFTATVNVGGYDFRFTFPIIKKDFKLQCAVKKKFTITVRGYGKRM